MLKTTVPTYYKARRQALAGKRPGAAFIFAANPEYHRNNDVEYPFRQDSSFYYLCGFDEPESFLVVLPSLSAPGASKSVLFVRERDIEKEMWVGERYGIDGALKVFGVDEVYPVTEFRTKMMELLKSCDSIYYRIGHHEPTDRVIFSLLESFRASQGRTGKSLLSINDPVTLVGEMRLYKSPEEVQDLRQACRISALAHKTAMEQVRPGMNESEVAALVDYVLRKGGCQREGYGSIVGGGRNATCLHYRANNEILRDGDLLLIDAGGEFNYFTGDITRTFPIGKTFTASQAKIYDLTLKSQLEGIQLAKPGTHYHDIHKHVCKVLTEGLLSLGVLKGNANDILKTLEYKRFFPHGTGHWLGMDVHDTGLYYDEHGESRTIEPGMVFTVEPGIYFQPTDPGFPAEFKHIGIRIEDDILITANGNEVLTSGAPKAREEIEALRRAAF